MLSVLFFLFPGAACTLAPNFIYEPQIVPLNEHLLHGLFGPNLDPPPTTPLPPVQNQNAQDKLLQGNGAHNNERATELKV